jgi:hypothetical protein
LFLDRNTRTMEISVEYHLRLEDYEFMTLVGNQDLVHVHFVWDKK